MTVVETVRWSEDGLGVDIIDQRLLPGALVRRCLRTADDVCDAILTLSVRGAPAIGIAGAMGLVAATSTHTGTSREEFFATLDVLATRIAGVRPTAVNLAWAVNRLRVLAATTMGTAEDVHRAMHADATEILREDREMCRRIGEHGVALLPPNARVLTHCNAGALATGGMGTALAPIYVAQEQGRPVQVFADETRPLLQGSRLTAWELMQAGIPVTVLADNMAASLIRSGQVDLVIVGADRIAANGDVANKIGTYGLALVARHHGIPFHVAAPWSTIDPATPTGDAIVIEHRSADEMRGPGTPAGVAVYNPAFDVTPASLITSIVTDRGIHRAPFSFA